MAVDWQLSGFGSSYRAWCLRSTPDSDSRYSVRAWARNVTCGGPFAAAVPISDAGDDFMDWVTDTYAFVTYVVSESDGYIIIKDIA